MKDTMSNRGEAPEESHVVKLIHPTAALIPMSSCGGACGISRHSGFAGQWTSRHRWSRSRRLSRFARAV